MASSRKTLTALLLVAAVAAVALTAPRGADYPGPTCATCDYAGPPIDALVHGHVGAFFHEQPVMGSFSLLLRAPFAAAAHIGAYSIGWEYRLGALACLLVVGLLAWCLMRIMDRAGKSWLAQALVAAICIAGPMTFASLKWGHPEELLGGALCAGAVLLAGYRRPLAAGIVLGLALATKPWALLVVVPAMMVARERRLALLISAAATAALFTLPMLIGDPTRFWRMAHIYGVAGTGVTPPDVWWSYGHQSGIVISPHGALAAYVVPAWVWSVAHPLVVVLGVLLAVAYWWSAAGARPARRAPAVSLDRALELVALILLLRCVLDPTDYSYYHAPFILALASSEAVGPRRLPYAALVTTGALWLLTEAIAPHGAGALHAGYLVWALPTALYLGLDLFATGWLANVVRRAPGARTSAAITSS